MDVDLSTIPMPVRRAIEAELVQNIHAAAVERVGAEQALEILGAAVDAAAHRAGQAFAARAPGGAPSLEHFATVLILWQHGGTLEIADIRLAGDLLTFTVTRCGYVEMYARMGIARELHPVLSCRRDAAFAAGYSPRLTMDRPETIANGAGRCAFAFRWTQGTAPSSRGQTLA